MKNTQKKGGSVQVVPLGDRVLVRQVSESETQTASGIFIPESAKKEKIDQGEVVAVGEGRYENGKLIPMNVKVGDIVVFSQYGYEEIKVDGEEYLIVKQDNILAIIK